MSMTDITKVGKLSGKELKEENKLNRSDALNNFYELLNNSSATEFSNMFLPEETEYVGRELGEAGYGESRYDKNIDYMSQLPDIQDIRARNQSGFNKFVSGITKGIGLAATTFLDGTLGLIYGVGQGLDEARVSALWDNNVSNALQDVNKKMEEWLPNYRTESEQERNWWQNMGTANFWADGFLKNLGFSVGAFYSGNAWLKGLKALGWVKNAASAQVVGSLLSGFNEGRIEANNAQTDFVNMQNQLISDAREQRASEIANDDTISDEVKIERLKTLDDNVKLQQQDMMDRAHKAGLATLIGNTVILTADNMWQFGKLYSRGFSNAKGLMGRIQAGMAKEGITGGIKEGGKYVGKTFGTPKKIAKSISNAASEGFEELNQAAISEGAGYWQGVDSPDAYYKALKDSKAQIQTHNYLGSLGKGIVNTYGNGDRWEEFAIGFLTGAIGMPTFGKVNNADSNAWIGNKRGFGISGGIIGEYRSMTAQEKENEAAATEMNKYLDKLSNHMNYFSQSQSFTNAMNGFAADNNEFEYKNMSDNDDFAAASRFAQSGRLDDLKELVNQDFENMSDEQLAQIAVNTTPNVSINEDGSVSYEDKDGNIETGGWRDATGKLMSETPEGREQMRKELIAKRDKILYEIDEYVKSADNVRALSNNSLPEDQVNELAWLDWKGKMFSNRYGKIKEKQEKELGQMLEASQRYSNRAADDLETYNNMMNAVKSSIDKVSADINETEDLIAGLKNDIAKGETSPITDEQLGKMKEIDSKINDIRRSKSMYARERRRKVAQQERLKESLGKEIIESKVALVNDYQEYVESQKRRLADLQASQKDIEENEYNEEEKKLGEYLQGIADQMTKFLSYISSSDNPLQLAAKIEANKDFIEWAEDGVMRDLISNEMGITGEEYDRIMHDLKDTAMIAKAAKTFKERYDEFSKNPAKLVANRSRLDKAKEKVNKIVDKHKTKKDINNKSVSDLVNEATNGDLDLDTLTEMIEGTSAEEKVNKAKEVINKKEELQAEISAAEAESTIKELASALVDDASGEDVTEVLNMIENGSIDPQTFRDAGIDESDIPQKTADLQEFLKSLDSMGVDNDELEDLAEVIEGPVSSTKDTHKEITGHDSVDNNPSMQDQKKAREEAKNKYESTTEFIAKKDAKQIADDLIDASVISSGGVLSYSDEERADITESLEDVTKFIIDNHNEGKTYEETSQELARMIDESPLIPDVAESPIYDYLDAVYGKKMPVNQQAEPKIKEQPVEATHQTTQEEVQSYNVSLEKSLDEEPKYEYYKPQQSTLPFRRVRTVSDFTPYYKVVEAVDKKESGEQLSEEEEKTYKNYHGKINLSSPYRKHVIAVGKHLDKTGAFSYVDNGNIQKGDTIGFTIDKNLNDEAGDVVVLMTKNGQVVGSMPSLKFDKSTVDSTPGLRAFLENAIAQWKKTGKITTQTKVNKYMIGQLPFTKKSIPINEVYGDEQFKLGISFTGGSSILRSNPGVTADTPYSDLERSTMSPLSASKGQAFLLFGTGDTSRGRGYIPIPFTMPILNETTANSQLGQTIREKLESLPNYNNNTVMPVLNDLKELLSLSGLHINYLSNGNIKIDIQRYGDKGQTTIFNQPAANISQAFNSLIRFSIPFQISRKYMNTTIDGKDYNRMIGELATVNLAPGSTHTVSNWFTVNPIDSNGNMIEGNPPASTRTNPDAHGSISVTFGGQKYSVNIGHEKVYDNNGNEYNGNNKLNILAYAEGLKKGYDMQGRPYISKFAAQNQLFDPVQRKFIARPTTSNDVITSFNSRLDVSPEELGDLEELLSNDDMSALQDLNDFIEPEIRTTEGLQEKLEDRDAYRYMRQLDEAVQETSESQTQEQQKSSTTHTYSPEVMELTKDFAKTFNGFFEGGGATVEDYFNIPKEDQYANAIINDFENTVLGPDALTFNKARKFLGILRKYNPERYNEYREQFLESRTPAADNNKLASSEQVIENRPEENPVNSIVQDIANGNMQSPSVESPNNNAIFEDLLQKARKLGFIPSGDIQKGITWNALTFEQQRALTEMRKSKANQLWERLWTSYDSQKGFNTTQLEGSVDDLLGIKNDTKYRIPNEKQTIESYDLNKEVTWLKKVLPQFSSAEHLQLVKGLTKMGTNTEVYGMFNRGIILLNSTTQTRGTTYHEAFHAIFDTLLTDEERKKVYEAGVKKFNKTGIALEEALAEDFRKYTQGIEYNDDKSILSKIWRKLSSWIKRLFGHDRILNKLYADINSGLYADRIPKVTDAIRMYDKELEDIKAKAIADGTFMKVRNPRTGELVNSNLNERQWLQVRTKAFKKWFGDWEKATKENPYSSEISVTTVSPDYDSADVNGPGAMFAILKGDEYIGSMPINANYKGANQFETWGEKRTNYVSMSSVGDDVEIEEEFRGKGYGKAAYFELAKQMANMGYILRSAPIRSRTEASTRVWESLVRDGYAKKVEDRYEFINSSLTNASKVVDENGEPLVVYHGTQNEFTTFDKEKIGSKRPLYHGRGFYFTPSINYAEGYSGFNEPLAAFLNIKNPNIYKSDYREKENTDGNWVLDTSVNSDEIKDHMDEIIVFNPNQIKSATDNVGTFSNENDDIRYREIENINRNLTAIDNVIDNADKDLSKMLKEEKDNLEYQRNQLTRSIEYKEWLSDLNNLSTEDKQGILDFGLTEETWKELDDEGRENALLCLGV